MSIVNTAENSNVNKHRSIIEIEISARQSRHQQSHVTLYMLYIYVYESPKSQTTTFSQIYTRYAKFPRKYANTLPQIIICTEKKGTHT